MDRIQAIEVIKALLAELNLRSGEPIIGTGPNTLPEIVALAHHYIKQEENPDTMLLSKAATVVSNICGFPCEIEVYKGHGYRVTPELETVQQNIFVYTFLKQFNEWYIEAAAQVVGSKQVMIFTDLVSAIFDFCGYWEPYKAINLSQAMQVQSICRRAQTAAAREIINKEQKKAGN